MLAHIVAVYWRCDSGSEVAIAEATTKAIKQTGLKGRLLTVEALHVNDFWSNPDRHNQGPGFVAKVLAQRSYEPEADDAELEHSVGALVEAIHRDTHIKVLPVIGAEVAVCEYALSALKA